MRPRGAGQRHRFVWNVRHQEPPAVLLGILCVGRLECMVELCGRGGVLARRQGHRVRIVRRLRHPNEDSDLLNGVQLGELGKLVELWRPGRVLARPDR